MPKLLTLVLLLRPQSGRILIGMVAGFTSERWPASGWNARPDNVGIRILGAIIPDLDHVVAAEQENLPTPAKPILPLHLRPALLAGVAIVERAGPEMLWMLRGYMMGDNRVRFTDAAENMIARVRRSRASSQMQLI
ncbi:hypothetical protein [Manganibacter manganicus]|uniref:hypothetical protein n=1 Tax=Manganibacter manganicus TaxID=1873176 RepID=UPI00195A3FA8|nr:hypothetical protein [Pseudaminobacter manganicus]